MNPVGKNTPLDEEMYKVSWIDPNGPADTVRAFYKLLRDKKFREAIFLTNLRPAIEGLTDMEMKDFALDFEAIAGDVPAEIEINGEIITGDQATVTANLPTADGDKKAEGDKKAPEGEKKPSDAVKKMPDHTGSIGGNEEIDPVLAESMAQATLTQQDLALEWRGAQ